MARRSRRSRVEVVACGTRSRSDGSRSRSGTSSRRSAPAGSRSCSPPTRRARASTSRHAATSSTSTCPGTRCAQSSGSGASTASGQHRPVVTVKNYFVPGTVEESVYAALRARIDDFADLLGNLQPILGATEEAFRAIFRAPRSERKRAEEEAIRSLDVTIERVRDAGVDIEVEDPMPAPTYSSVTSSTRRSSRTRRRRARLRRSPRDLRSSARIAGRHLLGRTRHLRSPAP